MFLKRLLCDFLTDLDSDEHYQPCFHEGRVRQLPSELSQSIGLETGLMDLTVSVSLRCEIGIVKRGCMLLLQGESDVFVGKAILAISGKSSTWSNQRSYHLLAQL